jgi:hypothetical protein
VRRTNPLKVATSALPNRGTVGLGWAFIYPMISPARRHAMADHPFIDHSEGLERWLEEHDGLWVTSFVLLLLMIYGFAIYTFAHTDAFLLNSGIPFMPADW